MATAGEGPSPRYMTTPEQPQEFSAEPPKAINVSEGDPEDIRYEDPSPAGGVFNAYYQKKRFEPSQRLVIFLAGLGVLTFVLFPTAWSCYDLLDDDIYVYFFGRLMPNCILIGCVATIVFFAMSMVLFFRCGRAEKQNEQSLWTVFVVIFSFLGLVFLGLSLPMHTDSLDLANDLWTHCQTSTPTRDLYEQYELLYMMRIDPSCIAKESVEDCHGYNVTFQSLAVKAMEAQYRCSGFCMMGTLAGAPSASNSSAGTSLKYPPTLFSQHHYKMSCDGAAGRHLTNFVDSVAYQTFLQGFLFIALSVVMGFLQLFGFWMKTDPATFLTPRAGYGSMPVRLSA